MAHYMPYAVPQYLRELGKGVATWRTTSHTHAKKGASEPHPTLPQNQQTLLQNTKNWFGDCGPAHLSEKQQEDKSKALNKDFLSTSSPVTTAKPLGTGFRVPECFSSSDQDTDHTH